AALADRTLVVTAAGAGPFDSHVGTLALFNLLVAGVADRLRAAATDRLDRVEAAWQAGEALVDR
ncbi:MAG: RpiR family transcriptional regulator, partial [Ilumatobacteraceae bacterium]